jgi:hypothetical protein
MCLLSKLQYDWLDDYVMKNRQNMFFDFGRYHKAPDTAKYAFDKVGDLLGYDLESDDEEDDDEGKENDNGRKDGEVSVDIPKPSDKDAQPSSAINIDQPKVSWQEVLVIEQGATLDTSCPPNVAQRQKPLVEVLKASKDKLFLIFRLRPGYKLRSWHLVQVDEEETNWRKAKAEGVYLFRSLNQAGFQVPF